MIEFRQDWSTGTARAKGSPQAPVTAPIPGQQGAHSNTPRSIKRSDELIGFESYEYKNTTALEKNPTTTDDDKGNVDAVRERVPYLDKEFTTSTRPSRSTTASP